MADDWSFWRDETSVKVFQPEHRLNIIFKWGGWLVAIVLLGVLGDFSGFTPKLANFVGVAVGFIALPSCIAVEMYFAGEKAGKKLKDNAPKDPGLEFTAPTVHRRASGEYIAQVSVAHNGSRSVSNVRVAIDAICSPNATHQREHSEVLNALVGIRFRTMGYKEDSFDVHSNTRQIIDLASVSPDDQRLLLRHNVEKQGIQTIPFGEYDLTLTVSGQNAKPATVKVRIAAGTTSLTCKPIEDPAVTTAA